MSKIERALTLAPGGSSKSKENKIFVTVRVRPLSKKELVVKDQAAWECSDSQTIIYKAPPQDRGAPTSYTFDKVFGPSCPTDLVYEDGAKDVAMSALTGINATIFAYGQTSSGKTYTMRGVTECAVSDIYRHMENNTEREFVIKISAMEIYNEIVKDLLQPDSGPLRLLDDPEKGPIVEKLDEQIAKDREHLRHLIGICEEQRQVGETALNDTSSRSHQIIRLTVESRLREVSGSVKSFVASLNFVDLAGSERAAQTHAIGARLKEGCHVVSDKQLVKHLQRKVSRLEAELRSADRVSSYEILKMEKDWKITQMEIKMEELKHGNQGAAETIAKLQAEIREMQSVRPESRDVEMITDEGNGSDLKDENSRLHMQDTDIAKLEEKLENVQRSSDKLVMSLPNVGKQCSESSRKSNASKKKRRMFLPLGVSNNINRPTRAPCSPHSLSRTSESEVENRAPDGHTESR
uniref:Uncharacterized protein n=1 Tax=Avena sativa TaxID=4498 RepID=A0ACD6A9E0_AVESA